MSKAGLVKFLGKFPDNTESWKYATDEVRDIARAAKEHYNEHERENIGPCDFRIIKTPYKWNMAGKKYILDVYDRMSVETRKSFDDYLKLYFDIY